jgi:hypothetical protein
MSTAQSKNQTSALNLFNVVKGLNTARDLMNYYLNENLMNEFIKSEYDEIKFFNDEYKIICDKKTKEIHYLKQIKNNKYMIQATIKYNEREKRNYIFFDYEQSNIKLRYLYNDNNGYFFSDKYNDNEYYFVECLLGVYFYTKYNLNDSDDEEEIQRKPKKTPRQIIDIIENIIYKREKEYKNIDIVIKRISSHETKTIWRINFNNDEYECMFRYGINGEITFYLDNIYSVYKYSGETFTLVYNIINDIVDDEILKNEINFNLDYDDLKDNMNDDINNYLLFFGLENDKNDNFIVPVKKRLIQIKNPKNDLLNHLNTNFIGYTFSYCGDNNDNFYCENHICRCFHRIDGLKMTKDTLYIDTSKFDDCELLERTIIIESANYIDIKRVWETNNDEDFNMRECIEYEYNDILHEDDNVFDNDDEKDAYDEYLRKCKDTEDIIFSDYSFHAEYFKYLDYKSSERYFYYRKSAIASIGAYEIRLDRSAFESNRFEKIKNNLQQLCYLCNLDYTEY